MKEQALIGLTILLALLGCDAKTSVGCGTAKRAAGADVRWFGALRSIMHEGRTGAVVKLREVVPGPHAWGLGALEGLLGEVTVLDDVVWLARPRPDGTAETARGKLDGADAELGAALFVVAKVNAWEQVAVQNEVPWSGLDSFLADELAARGLGLDAPVPVRIEGPVAKLEWHVMAGAKRHGSGNHADHARSAIRGALERADVRLIGFYSSAHEGVFTHAGARSHLHVLVEDQRVSGHVDGVVLQPGARLLVAK